ncbi:hypothetical protein BDA99DRAFT_562394 [Phascolomyces articulosus]|uniref:Fe2OG dioxygenase domain-containing protein n=1 Tax=Phascolomyces articulosus TaxID=60185 RepID=A0AAD5K4F8_9FUNG|nr:hypothetical protein BDA99DRAFT_562394 [Phascolomyces articulosus]
MDTPTFPVIDFSDFENRFEIIAKEILEACHHAGFFCIIHHQGPTSAQFNRIFEMGEKFFQQPIEEKIPFGRTQIRSQGGYVSLTPEELNGESIIYNLNKSEAFDVLPPFGNQELPNAFLENKQELDTFYKDMHSTVTMILEALSFALKIPANPESGANDYLSSRHRYEDSFHTNFFHIQRYPASSKQAKTTNTKQYHCISNNNSNDNIAKKEVIHTAHADNSTITLLSQKDVAGLQVEIDGNWVNVPIIQDAILVNVGDTLHWWTRGYLKAVNHRVLADPELKYKDRYSSGYFINPKSDTLLAGIPSPFIPSKTPFIEDMTTGKELTFEEYITEKFKRMPYKLGND